MSRSRRFIEVTDYGDVILVNFVSFPENKILDESVIVTMGQELFRLVDVLHHYKIILSFKDIAYLSSMALGKFITLQKNGSGCQWKAGVV